MRKPALGVLALLATTTIVQAKDLTVGPEGSDFRTVQEALAAAPAGEATTIRIKPGEYQGHFVIPKSKPNITLVGESAESTRLVWPYNVKGPIPPGHDKFNPGLHVQADNVRLENLTIANTSGEWGQGLAARIDGDRFVARNCRFLGWQDTVMVNNGRHYFADCYIEGRVDFIYGSGTSLFDRCHIHTKGSGGYVTAASTPQAIPFGFVFLDCRVTGDPTPWDPATTNPATTQEARQPGSSALLGRPWRPYAAVAFLRCELGDHVQPAGWHNWGKPANEKTARYAEYKNTGPGAKPDGRVTWARQLSDEEAAKYTIENVLGAADGWDPRK